MNSFVSWQLSKFFLISQTWFEVFVTHFVILCLRSLHIWLSDKAFPSLYDKEKEGKNSDI